MSSDELKLLAAAKKGEALAVEKLLSHYEPKIFRFGLRMCGNEQDAKEVLQETLLAAFKGIHGFRQEASLSTWLFQIARSFCIKERRGLKNETVSIDDTAVSKLAEDASPPDSRAHARQIGEAIQAAIAALSEAEREVILLRDVEGMSAEEAAEVVGIEVRALKSRLHRARMKLRENLSAVLEDDEATENPCPELAEELSAYTASEIDEATCVQIEAHLARCSRCSEACESLKKSVSLCRSLPGGEVPASVRAAVRKALRGATSMSEG